jgi:hypothetical protein
MPTLGGLLQVLEFQVIEEFDETFVYAVLGQKVGTTFVCRRPTGTTSHWRRSGK